MSIVFGSPEANAIAEKDRLLEKIRAKVMAGGEATPRLENIEVELSEVNDEIEFCREEIFRLEQRKNDLLAEKKRIESGDFRYLD